MYEVHAWFGISESTRDPDEGTLDEKLTQLHTLLAGQENPNITTTLQPLNGQHWLTITGSTNRNTTIFLNDVIDFLGSHLPGSWGIIYERDDETPPHYPANAYRVRTLTRGVTNEHTDIFLSPCNPTIED